MVNGTSGKDKLMSVKFLNSSINQIAKQIKKQASKSSEAVEAMAQFQKKNGGLSLKKITAALLEDDVFQKSGKIKKAEGEEILKYLGLKKGATTKKVAKAIVANEVSFKKAEAKVSERVLANVASPSCCDKFITGEMSKFVTDTFEKTSL